MLNILFVIVLLLHSSTQKCLAKKDLVQLGFKPLESPQKLENPSICTEIFKESKTCVETKHLTSFLNSIYQFVYFKDSNIITSIYDDIKELSEKVKADYGYFNNNKIVLNDNQQQEKQSNPLQLEVNSSTLIDLKNRIINSQDDCLRSQAKFILGTFCMLASNKASEFISHENLYKKNVKQISTHSANRSLVLKVEQKTSDLVLNKCMPVLKGLCVSSQFTNPESDLKKGKLVFKSNSGCHANLFRCKKIEQCTAEVRNSLFSRFFGAFGFSFGQNAFKEGPGLYDKNERGGWYQKLKEALFYSTQKISQILKQAFQIFQEGECDCGEKINLRYKVSEEGRDFVKDGANSGIYQEYPEVLFVTTGFFKFADLNYEQDINLQVKSRYDKIQRLETEQTIPLWINLVSNEIEMENERQGIDLLMVIDISGSMGGKKIKLVKQTLLQVLQEMRDFDRFALICFNEESKVLAHFIETTKDNKMKLKKKIKGILTQGGTNLKTPLEQCISLVMNEKDSKNIASIFFMSDGQDTSSNSFQDITNSIKKQQSNLEKKDFNINCFGFGEDHDEKVLTEISKNFNGYFYYIKKANLIDECYYSCLSYILTVIATKAKINVFLSEGLKFKKTYGARWSDCIDKSQSIINVNNIISEMDKEFLAEISIPKIEKGIEELKIAIGVLNFTVGQQKFSKTIQLQLKVVDDNNLGEINQEVEECFSMHQVGQLYREFKDLDLVKNEQYNIKKKQLSNQVSKNQFIGKEVKRKINKILLGKQSQTQKHVYNYMNQIEEDYFQPGKTNLKSHTNFCKKIVKKRKKKDVQSSDSEEQE